MRTFARMAMAVALLVVQQAVAPLTGSAQVDPCTPVPIPGLCETPEPSPLPSPVPSTKPSPSPSPSTSPKPDSPKKKKKPERDQGDDTGTDQGGENRRKKRPGPANTPQGPLQTPDSAAPPEDAAFTVYGPMNTSRLVRLLSRLEPRGIPLEEALLSTVGPFPIAGLSYWTDDWHAPRSGGRVHKGLDMFAPRGTPLVAIADGVISQKYVGELPGISVEITDDNGVQYFYAHMDRWEQGIAVGQRVRVGQVIGYLGNTGNAIYTPPHLHLEVQPGGTPVPPIPYVMQWLETAERKAARLIEQVTGEKVSLDDELVDTPVAIAVADEDFRITRTFDLVGEGDTSALGTGRLLLLAGLQPAASSLEIATRTLDEMAWEIDWTASVDEQLAQLAEQYREVTVNQQLVGPDSPLSEAGPDPGAPSLPTAPDGGD
ncbi:MAG: M23 family metallopeptidase [Actinomycetota bacterium]|nr:M23 family metallopeptidase [Actinomycetota bacterium]